MLAEAGCEVPQIASITGHTLQSATRILEKYMAMTPALSKAAIQAFENSPATAFADQLQTGPPRRRSRTVKRHNNVWMCQMSTILDSIRFNYLEIGRVPVRHFHPKRQVFPPHLESAPYRKVFDPTV